MKINILDIGVVYYSSEDNKIDLLLRLNLEKAGTKSINVKELKEKIIAHLEKMSVTVKDHDKKPKPEEELV